MMPQPAAKLIMPPASKPVDKNKTMATKAKAKATKPATKPAPKKKVAAKKK